MTELMEKSRTTRLLMVVVVLFGVIILLQLGVILQRQLNRSTSARSLSEAHSVWSQGDDIESMHADINRLFDQAFHNPLSVPQPPAAKSNAPFAGGSAVSFEDPFVHMRRMQRQIDAMFAHALDERGTRNTGFDEGWARLQVTPGFNIQEKDSAYQVLIRLPGVEKSGIHITLNGAVLSITADQEFEQRVEHAPDTAHQIRRSSQHYERHLRLPGATSDQSKIQAAFTNDLLSITIPKEAPQNPVVQPVQIY